MEQEMTMIAPTTDRFAHSCPTWCIRDEYIDEDNPAAGVLWHEGPRMRVGDDIAVYPIMQLDRGGRYVRGAYLGAVPAEMIASHDFATAIAWADRVAHTE